jgi:general stress protein YciG
LSLQNKTEKKRMHPESKGSMTVEEAGRKGGERTLEIHGRKFYREIGKKGGEIGGPKDGAERARQHEGTTEAEGKTSLEEAGHMGGEKVRRLIEKGKEQQNFPYTASTSNRKK